jgi:S-adenosylmethionine uptake transporter
MSVAALPRNAMGGGLLMLAWIFFTVEIVTARILAKDLATAQIAVFRMGMQALVFLPFILITRGALMRTAHPWLHVMRASLSGGGMILYYLAFAALPVAVATTLTFMQAGFMTLLAALILREPIGPRRMAAVAVGFVGVLVVMRPGFGVFQPAMLYALTAALAGASLMTLTRFLSRTESRYTIMAYSGSLGLIAVGIPAVFVWQPIDSAHWPLLALVGVVGTAGQFLMVGAFQLAEASALAPIDYTRLIFAVAAGYIMFSEIPDLWTWIGSGIIIASIAYTTHRERQLARQGAALPHKSEGSLP